MLEAHWLVLAVFAQLFMAEENHAHSDLFQPDDGADEPRRFHGAQRGEPGEEKNMRDEVVSIKSILIKF